MSETPNPSRADLLFSSNTSPQTATNATHQLHSRRPPCLVPAGRRPL